MASMAAVWHQVTFFKFRRFVLSDLTIVSVPFERRIKNCGFLLQNSLEFLFSFVNHAQVLERALSRLSIFVVALVRVRGTGKTYLLNFERMFGT